MQKTPVASIPDGQLVTDIRRLIDEAKTHAATAINAALTLLYWRVGNRIRREILGGTRAFYGDQVMAALASTLRADYGRGFSAKSLHRMVQFAESFPEAEIVATLSRQLSWSHVVLLLPLKAPLAREFYAEMARVQRWSVRQLRAQIDSMLYQRTAILDRDLLERTGISAETPLEVSTDGDVIVISPVRTKQRSEKLRQAMTRADQRYAGVFRRLAK